jgi:hypothetical protein
MYKVTNTTLTRQHINAISSLAHRREYIHNIYKLPSLESTVRYLHAAAGFPQNQHGSKPFDEATTALGPSST